MSLGVTISQSGSASSVAALRRQATCMLGQLKAFPLFPFLDGLCSQCSPLLPVGDSYKGISPLPCGRQACLSVLWGPNKKEKEFADVFSIRRAASRPSAVLKTQLNGSWHTLRVQLTSLPFAS